MALFRIIQILFICHLILAGHFTFGDSPNKSMETQVARDLIGPNGLFYSNKAFQNLFLLGQMNGPENSQRTDYVVSFFLNRKHIDRGLRGLQNKIQNTPDYLTHFKNQISLAYKHDQLIRSDLAYLKETKQNHKANISFQRYQSKDLGFAFGTLTNIGLIVLNQHLGGPEMFSTFWPIVGLAPSMWTWRIGLAVPMSRHSRRNIEWAQTNFRNHIADLGELICQDLAIPKFPRPKDSLLKRIKRNIPMPSKPLIEYFPKRGVRAKKEIPSTEVIQLSTHTDGSPLLVTKENLLAAIQFRNSLPIYKAKADKLISQNGLLYYPSTQIKSVNGMETLLKLANLHNLVLIPDDFRASGPGLPDEKLEALKVALTQFLNNPIMGLARPRGPSTTTVTPCEPLIAIGGG